MMTLEQKRIRKTARYLARTYGLLAVEWLALGRIEDAAAAARTAWTWAQTARDGQR